MINEVLFEHEAPFLDSSKQGLFEWSSIHTEPHVNHFTGLHIGMYIINIALYYIPSFFVFFL